LNIVFSKQAVKSINRMNTSLKQRIKAAIERLPDGNIKQIKNRHIVTYRLRVGDWRVLYSFESNDTILIEKIAPRGDVYKGV